MTGTARISVRVPKDMMGKVIGRGAATKLDIESDYGVSLTIPGRDSDSEDVIIEGPADKIEFAKNRVLDIIGQAPDASSGPRAAAQKLYDEAEKLFESARAATSPEEGQRLRSAAHEKRKEAEAANESASRDIFAHKNGGYGDDQMDLHGLQVKEAMMFVTERLQKVDARLRAGEMDLVIIPGQGIHSSGAAKIKPTVSAYLTEHGYPFEEDPAGGQFTVSFKGLEPQDGPSAKPVTPAAPVTPVTSATAQQPPQATPAQPTPAAADEKTEQSWWQLLVSCYNLCTAPKQQQQQQEPATGQRSAPPPTTTAPTTTPASTVPPAAQEMERAHVAKV